MPCKSIITLQKLSKCSVEYNAFYSLTKFCLEPKLWWKMQRRVIIKMTVKVCCPFLHHTVEPCPVDTSLLWTPHHCGHFSPGPFGFPYIGLFIKFHQCGQWTPPLCGQWFSVPTWDYLWVKLTRQEINALLQIHYSRTPPCGRPSFVDSPHLWTLVSHVHDRLSYTVQNLSM